MVLETKSGLEGGVVGGGHSVAASRLDAQRSVAGWVGEQMGGLSYLFYIRDLVCAPSCGHFVLGAWNWMVYHITPCSREVLLIKCMYPQ